MPARFANTVLMGCVERLDLVIELPDNTSSADDQHSKKPEVRVDESWDVRAEGGVMASRGSREGTRHASDDLVVPIFRRPENPKLKAVRRVIEDHPEAVCQALRRHWISGA